MNILLVDDEIAVIDILKNSISWKELGIAQVFVSYNAKDAKKMIEDNAIHIIVCDIEMPQENGITLLTWVQENRSEIINIILTSYPDFNYAKDAIDIGVFKFLLKPVSFQELKQTVHEAVLKIEEWTRQEKQREYGKYFESNERKAEKIFYMDLIREEILPFENHISREVEKRGMRADKLKPGVMVLFRVNSEKYLKEDENALYFALENSAEELFPEVLCFPMKHNEIWIIKGKTDRERCAEMCRIFKENTEKLLKCELYAYIAYDILFTQVPEKYKMLTQAAEQYSRPGQSIYFAEEWILNVIGSMPEYGNTVGGRETLLIETVKTYLEEHYNEPINRKDIENLVHLNQDYLNRVFKCATGYTLMQYIQYYRILEAKRYLEDLALTISEVGLNVGYDTPPYFSKMFKKWTGITPVEYRNSLEKI